MNDSRSGNIIDDDMYIIQQQQQLLLQLLLLPHTPQLQQLLKMLQLQLNLLQL